ncbi:hypothetical protein RB195_026572 [Necator americanus]|uniref:Uncharacterized protein n=1 Tax=Necator americanus TaxID=51031 RepID=A0ABR1EXJ9_NECAM
MNSSGSSNELPQNNSSLTDPLLSSRFKRLFEHFQQQVKQRSSKKCWAEKSSQKEQHIPHSRCFGGLRPQSYKIFETSKE